jgi:hypothetical protein
MRELERQAKEKQRQRREQERQARLQEEALKLERRKQELLADFTLIPEIKQQLIDADLLRLVETGELEAKATELRQRVQTAQRLGELADLKKELKSLIIQWRSLKTQAVAGGLVETAAVSDPGKELAEVNAFWERMASVEPLLNDLEFTMSAFQQNPVVKGWCAAKLEEFGGKVVSLREALNHAAIRLNTQALISIAQEIPALSAQGEQLLKEAEDKEWQEQQRAYVVGGIQQVLKDMGFVLDKGPDLLEPGDPASTVVMAASLPTGKNVAVKINQNGAIYTDFDGYSDDGCVQDLQRFKNHLIENFAIDYEIRGEKAHNPDKIKKGAKGVPGGAKTGEMQ